MNQTIQDLFSRKSTRVFTDDPITEEERRIILESALQAPTAGNMTLYSILDIQEQDLKEELAKRCDNQPFIPCFPRLRDCRPKCCCGSPIHGNRLLLHRGYNGKL